MKINTNLIVIIFATLLIFGGCSKDVEEYNKPAAYWYSKIVSSIADGDLEKADSYYSSLQGEHIGSPLLPEATMILSIAHMEYEEYILSEYFADEYIKRFANANEKEFAEFMKIKAKYMALPNPRRDQVLIKEAIRGGEIFKASFPHSMYKAVVDTMLTNLRMAEAALNENIADSEILVYPIPGKGTFTLRFKHLADNINLELYNSLNRSVYRADNLNLNNNLIYTLDLNHLPAGIYYLHVSGKKVNQVRKIIIQD